MTFHVADVRKLDDVEAVRGEFDLITSIFLLMDANGFPGVPAAGPLEWAALPPPDLWSATLSKAANLLSPEGILFSSERVDNPRAMAWWVSALAAAGLVVQWKRSAHRHTKASDRPRTASSSRTGTWCSPASEVPSRRPRCQRTWRVSLGSGCDASPMPRAISRATCQVRGGTVPAVTLIDSGRPTRAPLFLVVPVDRAELSRLVPDVDGCRAHLRRRDGAYVW